MVYTPGFRTATTVLLAFWFILWFVSFESWVRFGEVNYSMMAPYTGKFGVGCKRIWSEKKSNHILAFYPVERKAFETAMKREENKMPFEYFGEKGRKGVGRANK
jgi:hypothetical protein